MNEPRPILPSVGSMNASRLQEHLRDAHGENPGRERLELVTRHRRLHALGADHGHEREVPE